MKKPAGEDRPLSLTELLATPIDLKKTRRVLEFQAPITLFAEVDEKGAYHLIGVPHIPGHFQLGVLTGQQRWTPANDQNRFVWQERQERGGCLHYIHRSEQLQPEECVALVQHHPVYKGKRGQSQVLQDINLVMVTPLWDIATKRVHHLARHTYRCVLMHPCSCGVYQALQQTFAYHQLFH